MVLPNPPPGALIAEWGDNLMQVLFNFWVANYRTRAEVVDQINTAIYARFGQEGVRMKDQLSEQARAK